MSIVSESIQQRGLRHNLKLNRLLLSELDDFASLICDEAEERDILKEAFCARREEGTQTLSAASFVEDQATVARRSVLSSERQDWAMLLRMEREAVQRVHVADEPLDAIERKIIDKSRGLFKSQKQQLEEDKKRKEAALFGLLLPHPSSSSIKASRGGGGGANVSRPTSAASASSTTPFISNPYDNGDAERLRLVSEKDDDVASVLSSDSDRDYEFSLSRKHRGRRAHGAAGNISAGTSSNNTIPAAYYDGNNNNSDDDGDDSGSDKERPTLPYSTSTSLAAMKVEEEQRHPFSLPPRPMSATRKRLLEVEAANVDRTRRRRKVLRGYRRIYRTGYSSYLDGRRNDKRDKVLALSEAEATAMMDLELREASRAEYVRRESDRLLLKCREATLGAEVLVSEEEQEIHFATLSPRAQHLALLANRRPMWSLFMDSWINLMADERGERGGLLGAEETERRSEAHLREKMVESEADERVYQCYTEEMSRRELDRDYHSATQGAVVNDQHHRAARLKMEQRERVVRGQAVDLLFEDLLQTLTMQSFEERHYCEHVLQAAEWEAVLLWGKQDALRISGFRDRAQKLRAVEEQQNKLRASIIWFEQDWRKEMITKAKKKS